MQQRQLRLSICNLQLLVVILVVLTEREFMFSLFISQLLAKAILARGTAVHSFHGLSRDCNHVAFKRFHKQLSKAA
ncbi:hypothetical protein [Ewingella americana]|uniref:hypothetical protein n=1 Tax=Yersiniaceae TaxID=1903411 RepID=UPI0032201AC5